MNVITTEKIPIKSWADELDEKTLQQAKNLANLPHAFKWVAIMPDAHPGYGMPIGGVLATKDVVVPNAVGVDIGCGMEAVRTSLPDIDTDILKKISGDVRDSIPVGFKHHRKPKTWEGFKHAPDILIIQRELDSARRQLGTLGGGNHFIEFLKGDDGYMWILIHSGSRNFGFRTAGVYYKKSIEWCERHVVDLPDRELAFLPADSPSGKEYIEAMNFCLAFAQENRRLTMESVQAIVKHHTGCTFDTPIRIHHNFVALEKHFGEDVFVHRKGATQAFVGMKGIVPGSMGTPSYITEGLGNEESFSSCAHGAGRSLGRHEAMRTLHLEDEQRKTANVLGGPRTQKELQEAPGAYKDIEDVMGRQKDLVKILVKLTPRAVVIAV